MKKRGKVLIIEDELDWQEILKEYLEEAEDYFKKWSSPYQYWISDTFNRLSVLNKPADS